MVIVAMCHHVDEAISWTELERRHRAEAADDRSETAAEEPTERAEPDESEPPAEPRAPADD